MSDPAAPLKLDTKERKELEEMVRLGKARPKVLLRAKILLFASQGISNRKIAKMCDTSRPTVYLWRGRFKEFGAAAVVGKRIGRRPGTKNKRRRKPN
jgi:transposase